jgi:hypothetical protein
MSEVVLNGPAAPHFSLGFYFADGRSSREDFYDFVKVLIGLNTKIVGGRARTSGTYSKFNADDFLKTALQPDVEFSTLYINTPMKLSSPGHHEEATRMWLPGNIEHEDKPPVAIMSEYKLFTKSRSPRDVTPKISELGDKVTRFFWDIVEASQPSYAAILGGSDWLECPLELSNNKGSSSFRDFFVSFSYLKSENIDYIKNLYQGAYTKELKTGIYISCSPFFNPDHIWLEPYPSLPQRWDKVGIIIGSIPRVK